MIAWLTDYSRFPARRNCGDWFPWEVALHRYSELAIMLCYMAIPLLLIGLYHRGTIVDYFGHGGQASGGAPATLGTKMLGMFIFACGITHGLEFVIFDVALYPVLGVSLVVTALVSLVNVGLMVHAGALEGLLWRHRRRKAVR